MSASSLSLYRRVGMFIVGIIGLPAGVIFIALSVGYAGGSIPFGYWLARWHLGQDIRTLGSTSTGATNVLRTAGKSRAIATLVLDGLKGYAACGLISLISSGLVSRVAQELGQEMTLDLVQDLAKDLPFWAGVGAVLGHMFPCWLGFKGGKGVATSLGVICFFSPLFALLLGIFWGGVLGLTRIVSAASVATGLVAPVFVWGLGSPHQAAACFLLSVLIGWGHRANLGRLFRGEEPRLDQRTRQKNSQEIPKEGHEG